MGCRDSHTVSRVVAVLGAIALGAAALGWTGCEIPPGREPVVRPIPDKEQYLLSWVDRNFQDPEAHYQLGEYYRSERLWDKARYHLDQAIRFAPSFRKAQVALVQMLLDKGDREGADQAVQGFIRQVSYTPAEAVDLAKAFARAGLDPYALACFDAATQGSPGSALAFKELGLYYLGKNDTGRAKANLIRSFELNPNQVDVALHLGELGTVVQVPQLQDAGAVPGPGAGPPR
ncbi:MAG: hypothetical protein KBE04_03240 [Phycisphaerae bacterium]|nr:hypothetical protein [Phycisphaerae bacterium]